MRWSLKVPAPLGAVLAAGALVSCGSPVAPEDSDLVHVHSAPPVLSIQNLVQQPVYTFVVDPETLALVDWRPCLVPEECNGIAPGGLREIAFDDILGHRTDSRQAVVYHWRLVPAAGGGFQVDSLRTLVVRLR